MGLLGFVQPRAKALPTVVDCPACKLHTGCRAGKQPGPTQLVQGGLLVVHGWPVVDGDRQDVLPGKLADALRQAGWPPGSYTVATALACTPTVQPGPTHLAACRPQLQATIKAMQPSCIITFGQVATSSVITWLWGDEAGHWRRWQGRHIPDQQLNAWVCPVGLGGVKTPEVDAVQFYHDVRAALAVAKHGTRPWAVVPDYASQVHRVYDSVAAAAMLREVLASNPTALAFDYEATGLKPEAPGQELVSCSVAWGWGPVPSGCIAYPWHGPAVQATRDLLVHPMAKIAANTKFEERWTIAKLGTRVRGWHWCTHLAAHWEQPQEEVTSFKLQAYACLGQPHYGKEVAPFLKSDGPSELNRIRDVPLADLLLYNGLDALLEYMVAYIQMQRAGYPLPGTQL